MQKLSKRGYHFIGATISTQQESQCLRMQDIFLYSFNTKINFNYQTNKTVCLSLRKRPAVLLTAVLGVCLPIVQGAIKGANVWLLCSITLP